jgi:hypothetical protein
MTFFRKFINTESAKPMHSEFQTQDLKDSNQLLRNICQRREQAGEDQREARVAQAQYIAASAELWFPEIRPRK